MVATTLNYGHVHESLEYNSRVSVVNILVTI